MRKTAGWGECRAEEEGSALHTGPIVSSTASGRAVRAPLVPAGRMLPFVLVTALFFLWAIPNNFNDILIRQFMKSFEINRLQAGLVQFAFYMGYFLSGSAGGNDHAARRVQDGDPDWTVFYGAGASCFSRQPSWGSTGSF